MLEDVRALASAGLDQAAERKVNLGVVPGGTQGTLGNPEINTTGAGQLEVPARWP